jgi:hypothetical protein
MFHLFGVKETNELFKDVAVNVFNLDAVVTVFSEAFFEYCFKHWAHGFYYNFVSPQLLALDIQNDVRDENKVKHV